MRLRERGERQDIGLGLAHHGGDFRKRASQGLGDPVPLRGDLLGIGVSEDRLDRRGHRRSMFGGHRRVQVAHEVHPGTAAKTTQ